MPLLEFNVSYYHSIKLIRMDPICRLRIGDTTRSLYWVILIYFVLNRIKDTKTLHLKTVLCAIPLFTHHIKVLVAVTA